MVSDWTPDHLALSDHVRVMYTPVDSRLRRITGIRSTSQRMLNKLFMYSPFNTKPVKELFEAWKTQTSSDSSKQNFVRFLQTNFDKGKIRFSLWNVYNMEFALSPKYIITRKGSRVLHAIQNRSHSILATFLNEFVHVDDDEDIDIINIFNELYMKSVYVIFTDDVMRLLVENGFIEDKYNKRNPQKVLLEKQKILVNNFMQNSRSSLSQISLEGLRQSCKSRKIPYQGRTKTDLIQALADYRKLLRSQQPRPEQQQQQRQDVFGNTIVDPVVGNDGLIYDESSLKKWFQKDAQGQYVNIKYVYNDKGDRVPNYVSFGGKRPLSSYKKMVVADSFPN